MNNKKKVHKQININNTIIIELIFKPEDIYFSWFKECLESASKELNRFYQASLTQIKIELIYSRGEFNEKIGKATPEWMVAFVKKNEIFILSPEVIEQISPHKKNEIKKLIVHELSHIYNYKLNPNPLIFIDEGVALVLAKQRKRKVLKKERGLIEKKFLKSNIDYEYFSKNNGYIYSYWFIKKITEKFPSRMLIDLIKINFQTSNLKKEIESILRMPVKEVLK